MRLLGKSGRARLMFSAAAGALALSSGAAWAQDKAQINIAPQNLTSALYEFGVQTDRQVMFTPGVTASKNTAGVSSSNDERVALAQLLKGTGLTYRVEGDVFVIVQAGEGGSSPQGESAAGGGAEVEAVIVTAQKKGENIQDVPIAISAFTMDQLDAQKLEGGFDLLKAIPNVTFSKTNFSGYNFQIRGIGTQAVSATTDPGVAVAFNNTTLIVNRLFEQEYVDVERVEVLRGPQGTLYGRNATAGVINVISAKPVLGEFLGELKLETGNFAAKRVRGHMNVPVGDTLAVRGAFAMTKRDGYGYNEASETNDTREFGQDVREDVDGRDLWTARVTLGWEPTENLRVNLMWERFKEDDNRVRTSKQLCHRDTGPGFVAPEDGLSTEELMARGITDENRVFDVTGYRFAPLSQACKAGPLYADEAFGTPNGASLPYISAHYQALSNSGLAGRGANGLGLNPWFQGRWETPGVPPAGMPCAFDAGFDAVFPVDICNPDVYRGRTQSKDLRSIYSEIEPVYRADSDIFELSVDYDLDGAVFTSQTVYVEDKYYASQDYNRFPSSPIWNDSTQACGQVEFFGSPFADCTPHGEELFVELFGTSFPTGFFDTGLGAYAPLTDLNGDGIVDQTGYALNADPLRQESGVYTVDDEGQVRDEAGARVGFYRDLAPDGVLCDPQLGCSDSLLSQDLSRAQSKQFNQEFRLVTNYDGNFNFSLGANYTRFETTNDYFVFSNALTYLTNFFPFNDDQNRCATTGLFCRYVDPNPLASINGEGHNYFRSQNPYELTSSAIFGEAYWNITDTVKITAGLRYTWDKKVFSPVPSQLLLADYRELPFYQPGMGPLDCDQAADGIVGIVVDCPLAGTAPGGRGSVADPDIIQEWREPTGRLVVDWKPELGFTDDTLLYASASRGYKGGGANPPSVAVPARFVFDIGSGGTSQTFAAEYVNAFEVGAKNTLMDGAMTLNVSGFYYDYTDYQVSKIIDRRAVNDNFDATIWGLEMEGFFSPTRNLRFNWAVGYLDTRIADGEQSIDIMDRADGGHHHFANPDGDFPEGFDDWVVLQPWLTRSANCVVPRELMEALFTAAATGVSMGSIGLGGVASYCPGGSILLGFVVPDIPYFDEEGNLIPGGSGRTYWNQRDTPNLGAGFAKNLSGHHLPNAPEWTFSLGSQYTMALPGGWDATARADFYWQADSWARVYNLEGYDELQGWTNTNLSLWVENPDWGVKAEVYVKNIFDESPITGTFLNSEDSGLTTNVFTLDPRLVGVSVTKSF